MKKVVTILRGIPGSGKSTLAERLFCQDSGMKQVVSADHFFTKPDGSYFFDATKLGAAHAQCLRRFTEDLISGPPEGFGCRLVVDNTNTKMSEFAPYAALALAFGYELEILTLACSTEVAVARGIHRVPVGTVERMYKELWRSRDQIPSWWPHRIIETDHRLY